MGQRGVIALLALAVLAAPAQADSVQFSAQDGGEVRFGWVGNEVVYYSPPPVDGHWDASDTSTLTITSSPDVDKIDDISGNDRDLDQATAALKPHTGSTINGLGVLDMHTSTVAIGSSTWVPAGSSGEVWVVYENSTVVEGAVVVGASRDADTAAGWVIWQPQKNSRYGVIQTGENQNKVECSGHTQATSTTYVVRFASTGSAYAARINGTDQTMSAFAGSDDGDWFSSQTSNPPDTFGWGFWYNGSPTFCAVALNGEMLIVEGSNLPAWQISAVDTYLRRKWGQS